MCQSWPGFRLSSPLEPCDLGFDLLHGATLPFLPLPLRHSRQALQTGNVWPLLCLLQCFNTLWEFVTLFSNNNREQQSEHRFPKTVCNCRQSAKLTSFLGLRDVASSHCNLGQIFGQQHLELDLWQSSVFKSSAAL